MDVGDFTESLQDALHHLPAFLSIKQVADFLGVHVNTVYREIGAKKISISHQGHKIYIAKRALIAYVLQHSNINLR